MARVDVIEKKVSARTFISLFLVLCSLLLAVFSFFTSFTSYGSLLLLLQWVTVLIGIGLALSVLTPAKRQLDANPFLLQTTVTVLILAGIDIILLSFLSYILSILK
ncbi:hypothetical protein [Aneurinibacillus sp. REN35]|uniref:hypothetical protein n=1 Tax=Aneurinibacillus sp. REN35 TaxID=3237286 RepID=UPI003529B01A